MADVVAKFSLKNENMNAKFNLNEGNAVDAIFKIDAGRTTWGSIDGDIANQTDLYNILNAKANQSELDSLSETVSNNYTALESEINGLSTVVDNNYSETVERFENDELAVSNLTNTVSNNYTELNNKILTNSTHITSISDTINSFGDIVTYNASNFATSAQGTLADTALQPNDNISELVNNVGYITSASLPVVNNGALTIRANGETVGTFTANQAGDTTVEISIPDSATWGNITGNIQNQTDLVNALNNKQDNLTVQDGITLDNNIISGKPLEDAIGDIDELIPVQATVQNQLADKNFVNSSIATNTANFIGTFNSVAELEAYSGTLTNNDYAFVSTTDSAGNTLYDRYKWNGSEWLFEYELNNSSFTAAQWASINSGITSGDVSLISTAIQPNDNISELTNDAGYITSASLPTVNNSNITLQKNGVDVGSFTLNQSSNSTINFSIPTDTSDLTNNAGFITASSIPTVDQTYNPNSTNAQSGKAINGAKFIRNTASQSTSLAIKGSAGAGDCVVIGDSASSSYNENLCTVIGSNASSTQLGGTALGFYATVNGQQGISLGSSSTASATKAIQIGGGTNKTANTLQIGFGTSATNYQLLDGTTGLIPDARISSNIARTSAIPTESTVSGWGFTKNTGTVTSVNNVSPISGNVTLSIPTATSDLTNDSGFITSADLPTNYVTTNTAQTINAKKTFTGEKAILFKQNENTNKLGFTLYNPSDLELGAFEYRPNTINGNALLNVNTSYSNACYVGFRYWGTAVNVIAPKVATAGNYFIPTHITDGTNTATANNQGTVNISTLLPDISTKQDTLVSGTNIKTINNESILGSGNININSRNVGEIITSTLPLTDAGLHLLDGTLLQYGIYKEFIDYIADLYAENPTANYFTDETTWQASVTQYGSCGKFVYDSVSKTVRLPKISDILQSTTDINALGDLIEAGLPNITGTFYSMSQIVDGAFSVIDGTGTYAGTNSPYYRKSFDASRSSSIYGNSTTVQPQTIKAFVYIVVANSTKTSIQVDIDEIATDLNNKAGTDLANVTDTGKILMSGMGMPSDTYIDLTLGASGSTYTAPANGYFYIHGDSYNNSNFHAITVFYNSAYIWDTPVIRINQPAPLAGTADLIPVKKGQTIRIEFSNMTMKHVIFVYAVGSESEAQ